MNEMTQEQLQEQRFERSVFDTLGGIFTDYQQWDWDTMDMCSANGVEPAVEDFLPTSIVEALFALLGENSDVREYFALLVRQIAEERIAQIRMDIEVAEKRRALDAYGFVA